MWMQYFKLFAVFETSFVTLMVEANFVDLALSDGTDGQAETLAGRALVAEGNRRSHATILYADV